MRRGLVIPIVAALAAGCASNQSVDDEDDDDREQTVSVDQLPAAARATLMREAGAGKIAEIDKEIENGMVVYEADVILNGQKWEIAVNADGKLLGKELDKESDGEDEKDD